MQLPGGQRIDYDIDPLNRRIGKRKNGQQQYRLIYLDELRPLAELDAQGQLRSLFIYAGQGNAPTLMLREGKTWRLIADHLGSIRLVIDAETGQIGQRIDYDAWGRVTHDSQPGFQPFGFAGGIYDPDTGLTRFGARDYDAQTGRWTAKDPILFNGGDTNLYGYVLQDPVNLVDPRGLLSEDAQRLVNEVMFMTCGDTRDAHSILMQERVNIGWEALTPHGEALRHAENYLTSYNAVIAPHAGEYIPRPLAYISVSGMTTLWQGIRVGENIAGKNKQSPARISALFAGHQGAIEALIHYYFGAPYGCICKK